MDKVIGLLAHHRSAAAQEVVQHIEQYFKTDDLEVVTDEVIEYLSIQPVTLLMEGHVIFTTGFPKSASWKARLTLEMLSYASNGCRSPKERNSSNFWPNHPLLSSQFDGDP